MVGWWWWVWSGLVAGWVVVVSFRGVSGSGLGGRGFGVLGGVEDPAGGSVVESEVDETL